MGAQRLRWHLSVLQPRLLGSCLVLMACPIVTLWDVYLAPRRRLPVIGTPPCTSLAMTEPFSSAVSFEVEEGNDLFWGSLCTRCSVEAASSRVLCALPLCRSTQALPPCLCPAATTTSPTLEVGVSLPPPWLLGAGSLFPGWTGGLSRSPTTPRQSVPFLWCQRCPRTPTNPS